MMMMLMLMMSISCSTILAPIEAFTATTTIRTRRRPASSSLVVSSSPPAAMDLHPAAPSSSSSSSSGRTTTAAAVPIPTPTSSAADWHRQRRKAMMMKYGAQIQALETSSASRNKNSTNTSTNARSLGVPLLVITNLSLCSLSLLAGYNEFSLPQVLTLALFPGSMFSLWQLQILHDCIHGSLLDKNRTPASVTPTTTATTTTIHTKTHSRSTEKPKMLEDRILFWGSMPSIFGYYLYLKYGHLSHHTNVGNPDKANLQTLFESDRNNFEDGDVLFVAHRMHLLGGTGPTFQLPTGWSSFLPSNITVSISKFGFDHWQLPTPFTTTSTTATAATTGAGAVIADDTAGNTSSSTESYTTDQMRMVWNIVVFASSFLFERSMLFCNDYVVALIGKNLFFPNKPAQFHAECTDYARCACVVRSLLWCVGGWQSLVFLYLSETVWSIPPHPSSAMFVSNHPSSMLENPEGQVECVPSQSTYTGRWYDLFTLNTNYHCEHHDFPTVPFQ